MFLKHNIKGQEFRITNNEYEEEVWYLYVPSFSSCYGVRDIYEGSLGFIVDISGDGYVATCENNTTIFATGTTKEEAIIKCWDKVKQGES